MTEDKAVNQPALPRPPLSGMAHPLPFNQLSPRDFERLCLWLVEREGYERAEHLGAAGSEQGRDLTAWRGGELWAFQCKRVQNFYPKQALAEVEKVQALPAGQLPVGLVFLVTCDVSAETRQQARERCAQAGLACHFWTGTELDHRVKGHPDIVAEFFAAGRLAPGAARLPTLEQVAAYRAALAQELAAVHWGMDAYIEEEGALLPIDALPYDPEAGRRRENLLARLKAAPRLLVLGEPGSGKTVALQRLAWESAANHAGVVPVLLPLLTYAGAPLLDLIRAELQHTGHLRFDDARAVEAFLAQGEVACHFLFDGLNEVPPEHRNRLVEELGKLLRAHPRHAAAVTSRSQDETWRRLRVSGVLAEAVVVQPIAEDQIRGYLAAHLGARRGHQLYGRLDDYLRGLAQRPLLLWLIKEAGAAGEDLPGNRGELYGRFVARLLRRAGELGLSRAQRDALPPALAHLAFEMHQRQTLIVTRPEAALWLDADLVQAAADHGLLTGGDHLRFAPHQTMQEYFAARTLCRLAACEAESGPLSSAGRALRRWLGSHTEDLQSLAGDDWWAETFVQLAGLVDDPNRLARTVARANPWLAWWCVEEGQAVDEATRTWIEGRSVRLLRSERAADRRRAVMTLARMQSERTVGPLFQAAADADAEVAETAVRALVELGEPARTVVAAALRGADKHLWCAALRYLAAQPDDALHVEIPWGRMVGQPMVWVPPGPFLMGSDKARDPQAWDDELPQHTVTLPGYWIGRYPVTVARFKAFVAESGHRPKDANSLKRPDDHPVANVTWRDALAYCDWLAGKSGLPVKLPSEAEWEKAARGAEGRIYPWGDEFDAARCNSREGGKGTTTPVGAYSPAGDSPYGCADMAGNVWEWTRSLWGKSLGKPDFKYPYDPQDGREKLDDNRLRVLRGGSFAGNVRGVRCACRDPYDPVYWSDIGGFRVCVAPGRL